MTTVAEHLAQNLLKGTQNRLEKLKEIKAPEVMIQHNEQQIVILQNHTAIDAVNALVGCKTQEILTAEFISAESHTGKGGKTYLTFKTSVGQVNYFPNGRYGRFISYPKIQDLTC